MNEIKLPKDSLAPDELERVIVAWREKLRELSAKPIAKFHIRAYAAASAYADDDYAYTYGFAYAYTHAYSDAYAYDYGYGCGGGDACADAYADGYTDAYSYAVDKINQFWLESIKSVKEQGK